MFEIDESLNLNQVFCSLCRKCIDHKFFFGQAFGQDLSEAQKSLTPLEELQYQKLLTDKRKRDWLAGRLAAKRAVIQHPDAPNEPSRVQLVTESSGAPSAEFDPPPTQLTTSPQRARDLSITHGHGRAYSVYSPGVSSALDLEQVKDMRDGSLRFFLRPRERGLYHNMPKDQRDLTSLAAWCLKEAAYKALRPERGPSLLDVELGHHGQELLSNGLFEIRYHGLLAELFDDHSATKAQGMLWNQGELLLAFVVLS